MDWKGYDEFDNYREYQRYMALFHQSRIAEIDAGCFNHFEKPFIEKLKQQSLRIAGTNGIET